MLLSAFKYKISIKQLILLCILTLSHTSAIAHDALTPTSVALNSQEPLTRKITSKSGNISFSTNLNQGKEIKIIFSEKKRFEHSTPLILITSDKNCVGEHETSISFSEKAKYNTSKYFDERTPWRKPLTYSLTWKGNKNFILTLNNQSIPVQINKKPKYIHILTNGKSVNLHQFLIQQQ